MPEWLELHRGGAPLIVCFPHTGTELPDRMRHRLVSPWLAAKDADWWVHELYGFVRALGATTVRTRLSRTVIDVNRDPSGASLYPGQATTELCPTTTFDGEPLYRAGDAPSDEEIAQRREEWFAPYHSALGGEIDRLRTAHPAVVVYDAHSIRSDIPRLFEGELPHFNLGTNRGASCAVELRSSIAGELSRSEFSHVIDGRFVGGWTTRRYGTPVTGVHAVQMELACRTYLDEPDAPPAPANWPPPYDAARAAKCREVLERVLTTCLDFAKAPA